MQQAGSLSVLLEPDQFEQKSNFFNIDIWEGNINDNSKLLIIPINVILIKNLVALSVFQIHWLPVIWAAVLASKNKPYTRKNHIKGLVNKPYIQI